MQILIVDDSPFALRLLERALTSAGHVVTKAQDGHEALEILQQGNHRMVISDWEMPEMDGLALCREVRSMTANYIYFILLTSRSSTDQIVEGMSAGADDFVTKPFDPAELGVRIRAGERVLALETRDVAIFAMAKLAEARDQETGQHLERVRSYAELLARRLRSNPRFSTQIDPGFIRLIYDTSPLHDIGKVGIPDQILLKPGRLTTDEYEVMKTHTIVGKETLDAAVDKFPDAQFLRFARDVAATHHERFDGGGYPFGLRGDAIPLCGRIVALADVYDALTSKRVYKEKFSHQTAVEIIAAGAGTQFDPDIVKVFLELQDEFERIAKRFSDSPLPAAAEPKAIPFELGTFSPVMTPQ